MTRLTKIHSIGLPLDANLLPKANDETNADEYYATNGELSSLGNDIESLENSLTSVNNGLIALSLTVGTLGDNLDDHGLLCKAHASPTFTPGSFVKISGFTTDTNDAGCTVTTDKLTIGVSGRYRVVLSVLPGSGLTYLAGGTNHALLLNLCVNGLVTSEAQHIHYDPNAGSSYRKPAECSYIWDAVNGDYIEGYYYLTDGTFVASLGFTVERIK